MTVHRTTKADVEDAEGRLAAANEHIAKPELQKAATPKYKNQQGCAESHPLCKVVQQGLGLAETEHKHTDYGKDVQHKLIFVHCRGKKKNHKRLILGEFVWNGVGWGAPLLGKGVDGCVLPLLQSLLHTFQQAPATGRPGVYLTGGLNGPQQ